MKIVPRLFIAIALVASTGLLSGCISKTGTWGQGAQWPTVNKLGQAAKKAAGLPNTWVPVVTAGLLIAADVDQDWSEDLARHRPLFGSDAEGTSDDLRDIATGGYLLSALFAPSASFGDKARGLAVGAGTMILDGVVSQGLKDLSSRERPDNSNDESFPSGHASKAASRSAMARRNIEAMGGPNWLKQAGIWGLHGVAIGTGLARVEANKHHLSDVLVGYAMGQFVANFMHFAFMSEDNAQVQIKFSPVARGGVFTLTLPLH